MSLSLLLVLAVGGSACGGDPAGDSAGGTSGPESTSEDSGSSSTGVTSGTTATAGATGGVTSPTTTAATSSSTSGDPGTSTTGDACELPDIDFEILELHLADLTGIADLTATHPGPKEAVSFFTAPGYGTFDVAFAGPLVMACSEPLVYDPYCEEERCSQISCTGQGAGWEVRTWLDPAPVLKGDFEFTSVETKVAWADGATGTTFTLSSAATRGQEDWTVTGQGTMDLTTMTVNETFPGLVPGATTVLTDAVDQGTHAGALTVDGVEIAIVTPDGHLQPTGQCP